MPGYTICPLWHCFELTQGGIEGGVVLVAFDINSYDSVLIDGDSGKSFADLVGAKGALFVPQVIVRLEVLKPCGLDTRRAPGECKFTQDPM